MSLYRGPSIIGSSTDTTHAMVLSATASAFDAATAAAASKGSATAAATSASGAAASKAAVDGLMATIAGGPVASVNGRFGTVVLTKTDVSLSNADNTSDTNKPVSTAQQTALNLKANLASPTFTGTPAVPTATALDNSTQAASTAFVLANSYRKNNILGTASQSAGVPTGSVIERGSNANGEYVRFADGTQICTVGKTGVLTTTASGSLYRATLAWTFPAAFIYVGAVVGSGQDQESNGWIGGGTLSTTAVNPTFFTASATITSSAINLAAVGRWF